MIKGIDISSWQQNLDVKTLSARGINFCIAKISEGQSWTDPCFDRFYNEAYSINLPFGAYVYSHACTEAAARAEANKALSLLRGRPLQLGVWLDVEDAAQLNCANLSSIVNAFCDVIRAAGYTTGAYGSAGQLWARVSPATFRDYVWAASWGLQPRFDCDVWQYTDHSTVDGYSGPVDGDYSMSDRFRSLIYGEEPEPAPQPAPDPAPEHKYTDIVYDVQTNLLRMGDYGPQVKNMQVLLNAHGFDCGKADGIFGQKTKSALLAFQEKAGIMADGSWGGESFKTMWNN